MTCPYCVQWRCAICKSDDWPLCCDNAMDENAEAYWPDGSVATVDTNTPCAPCQQSIDDYVRSGDGL